jgi:acyl-CoA synthetase (AMP-forming)/AMP-acid ligase II
VTTVPGVLAAHATAHPDRPACTFLDERGTVRASLTYGELHRRALAVAARLRRRYAPGERALLAFPQGLDFVVAFLGCLHAGVIAVPVNPPRRSRVQEATASIVADCAPAVVLTGADAAEALRAALHPHCGPLDVLLVDAAADEQADELPAPVGEEIAFLQYTSGSTAEPKGVLVTHANLVANEEMIRCAFGHDAGSTVVGWAPFFHDQGLIGNLLQPLWVGATAVLMSPMTFVRRPLLWLETISRYRAHTSGGPNFAYDACVAAARRGPVPALDLSCWEVAFNGAEPVRPETLREFAATFGPYGFEPAALHPCYGLAEATLIVTGSGKGRGPRTTTADAEALAAGRYTPGTGRELAGSGTVLPGEEIRIVDPETRLPCPPDRVGEIWVLGPHVARGYWRRPDATRETFRAELPGEPGRYYLRTGDLGVLVDDELLVVGRLKDITIIRGRNHHSHDIEHTVAGAHPALQPGAGAAFAVAGSQGEQLVVVQEVRREHRRAGDRRDVTAAVRAALAREHGLSAEVVLTLPGRVPRTSSGKVRRAAARRQYAAGGFDAWQPV